MLAELAGKDSWFTLTLLQINTAFLEAPANKCPQSQVYLSSTDNMKAVNVVNDAAERGVKLSTDFLSAARLEEQYQNVLQVVEKERKERPNLRKRKLQNEFL